MLQKTNAEKETEVIPMTVDPGSLIKLVEIKKYPFPIWHGNYFFSIFPMATDPEKTVYNDRTIINQPSSIIFQCFCQCFNNLFNITTIIKNFLIIESTL